MASCISCGAELPIAVRFCSSCGTPVGSDDMATLEFATKASPRPARSASASSQSPSSSGFALNEGRFLPGRLLAGRYRIIALLGKGGMGEVYRADDLTLGQPVALKFLPEQATRDESLLERFRNEVRIARRVSHPNVCRVYDVGEVDGYSFFTMEYVDGEDLASLLRRIGRLPQDKATDIARQLCAGLAAAHAKGVLHRDLKPANIMLDGRGQVVMTDFGLAGLADQIHGADVRSGTPAYMSPEQLAGKEVTTQSDIYALGLVLYEIFTGKRAFTAETLAELVRTGTQSTPSRPSSVVKDLDPAVERVILRCLEPEPRSRPESALSVAAALPGGDPLAAALAAGETPSPQMVAAAGESGGLAPRVAIACLAAVLIGLAACVYMSVRPNTLERAGLELSPEVLSQKARETITRLGYPERPADSATGFFVDSNFTDYAEKNDKPQPKWDEILAARPSPAAFWYRQSPDYLLAHDIHDFLLTPGIVDGDDPPSTLSGMIRLMLDPRGRLIYFDALPAQRTAAPMAPAPVDWSALFAAADLDLSQFQPAQPTWTSLAAADTRVAWTGKWPGTTRDLRIEAAAWQGKPVFFYLTGAWTKPDRMKQEAPTAGKKWGQILGVVLLGALMLFSSLLARRNYRHGRGDRDGAVKLATIIFGLLILLWLFRGHLVPSMGTFGLLVFAIAMSMFIASLTFVMYMAVEPYVRRYWPHSVISWSRLLSGRTRDPLVGSDILFGVLLGVVWLAIFQAAHIFALRAGGAPQLFSSNYLSGTRPAMGMWLSQIPDAIIGTLQFFFILLGLKLLFRRDWLAAIAFVALFTVLKSLGTDHPMVDIPIVILVYSIAAMVVFRFGLVALACAIFTVDLLANVPLSADLSVWYMSTSLFAFLSVVALAGWGFYTALGGEPLWKPEL
jgi:tRNA A-37 threonylcarbamoyl transferase component Bud32